MQMQTVIRRVDPEIWKDFLDAAKAQGISGNQFLLNLIEKESKKWRRGEDARILKLADEIRQRKLPL